MVKRIAEPEVLECLRQITSGGDGVLLPWEQFENYQTIDPHNARLRELLSSTIEGGTWQLLWIPSSLPYYRPTGAFAGAAEAGFTKRLVFSSWQMVPKSIATLLSYEVERRMMTLQDPAGQNTAEARERRRPLLRFTRSDGRLTGMAILGLLYPARALARSYDPLRYKCDQAGQVLECEDMLGLIENSLSERLATLARRAPNSGPEDEAWYWAAPILLDLAENPGETRNWWNSDSIARDWSGEEEGEETPAGRTTSRKRGGYLGENATLAEFRRIWRRSWRSWPWRHPRSPHCGR